jgi:hypothetical protein
MSMNLRLYLAIPGQEYKYIKLLQTPNNVSNDIVYKLIKHPNKLDKRSWQDSATKYLKWVTFTFKSSCKKNKGRACRKCIDCLSSRDLIKSQRKIIGDAWSEAEENSGQLIFEII